jgi:hypothetical protein
MNTRPGEGWSSVSSWVSVVRFPCPRFGRPFNVGPRRAAPAARRGFSASQPTLPTFQGGAFSARDEVLPLGGFPKVQWRLPGSRSYAPSDEQRTGSSNPYIELGHRGVIITSSSARIEASALVRWGCRLLALRCRPRCPLPCRQSGDKRTRYVKRRAGVPER